MVGAAVCVCVCVCLLFIWKLGWYKTVYLDFVYVYVWRYVCLPWYENVCACVTDTLRVENTVTAETRRKVERDKETNGDISWFWQAPCQGEIVSDARLWHDYASPHVALYMKLVLFSISSLFKCGAGAAQRGGCRAWRVGWNWTASPHYCKHHPTRQASRSQGRRMRGPCLGGIY